MAGKQNSPGGHETVGIRIIHKRVIPQRDAGYKNFRFLFIEIAFYV